MTTPINNTTASGSKTNPPTASNPPPQEQLTAYEQVLGMTVASLSANETKNILKPLLEDIANAQNPTYVYKGNSLVEKDIKAALDKGSKSLARLIEIIQQCASPELGGQGKTLGQAAGISGFGSALVGFQPVIDQFMSYLKTPIELAPQPGYSSNQTTSLLDLLSNPDGKTSMQFKFSDLYTGKAPGNFPTLNNLDGNRGGKHTYPDVPYNNYFSGLHRTNRESGNYYDDRCDFIVVPPGGTWTFGKDPNNPDHLGVYQDNTFSNKIVASDPKNYPTWWQVDGTKCEAPVTCTMDNKQLAFYLCPISSLQVIFNGLNL